MRIQDVSQSKKFEDWGFTEVSENNFGKFQLKKGDIIVARTGATIGVNRFINEDINAVFNNGLIKLKVNENKCLPKYLFYNLQSYNYWGYIDGISGGTSTQPNMQINALLKYEIQLPPLPEQKAIASVLSSLDDKIDLLHLQNQTLEALAETLFRQWFIEEAKEDWEDCTIEDLCIKINSGGTPSTKIDSYYNGNINWYSTKELNDNFLFSSNSKITQEGLDNSSAKIFPAGTVVIAIYAAPTVGRLGILTEDSAFNQAACGLVANDKICSKEFLYLYLKNQRVELNLMASGSAQQNLNVGKIKSYPCFVPDSITMEKFKFQVIPLFSKVLDNSKQIQTLTQIRDTLLPKLMSGEVRVKM
ncbi:restriction endonuclease subunit S [Weeksella virosa]|uniref:restriction endonuclease subunit S n=1 Tax=Weeksella virosa TaxID=1014 RepID=UPI0025523EE6|nr:restriction endonuclease subunit S [Weeksella virosa]MDK7675037.1 restriction endonuclease subunit S [Weeksella virosa]